MIPYLVAFFSDRYPQVGKRVYTGAIPQNSLFPALRISENRLTGDNTKESISQLDDHQLRIDIFSPSYKETHTLSSSIRTDIDRQHRQPPTAPHIAGIVVQDIRDAGYDHEKRLYHRTIDFTTYTKPE